MEPRQAFHAYGLDSGREPSETKYCPGCGAGLSSKEVGGRKRQACPDCGYVHYRNPSAGVCAMVVKRGKVLLGRRAGQLFSGKWAMPGGFVEFDEDFLTATRREVKEETGLDVEIKSILSVATNYLTPELHTLSIVCLAEPVSGEEAAADDLSELMWVDPDGPFPPMAFEADEHIIRRYHESEDLGVPVDPRFSGAQG